MKYPQLVSMPSAVSDWLEEQLEARGIDAVVYTRYVLSLLHTHTVDVIYPDEDLQFSHLNKEVRRSSGSRKRFRRSSDWWRHAQADAEQIKRSAAVECLMSASDQSCEIESLVDELCEKLKQVNITPPLDQADSASTVTVPKESQKKKISAQELVERYYAAFPPLRRPSPLHIISSAEWKPISLTKNKNNPKHNNRQTTCENKFKNNSTMYKTKNQNKPRVNKSGVCPGGNLAEYNANNWEVCSVGSNKDKNVSNDKQNDMQRTLEECVEMNKNIWNNDDEEVMQYDDLPVDIHEILDSPSPQDETVELMNMANMKDNGKRNFIPYTTDKASIWSNDQDFTYNNKFNTSFENNNCALQLGSSCNIITAGTVIASPSWPYKASQAENFTNRFSESDHRKWSLFSDSFYSSPDDWKSTEECFENEQVLNQIAMSLIKLNHDKETSCFTEVIPRPKSIAKSFSPFSHMPNMFTFNPINAIGFEREKEDLLTSDRSHFKPINEKIETSVQGPYADGSTFVISSTLDKVNYKRSQSGAMLLENEFGQSKKYWKYKQEEESTPSPDMEFELKFSICQNDKACQTEELSEVDFSMVEENSCNSKLEDGEKCTEDYRCTYPIPKTNADTTDNFSESNIALPPRPESVVGEIVWKYETKICDKCNSNITCSANLLKDEQVDPEWDSSSLRSIWSDGEVCNNCSNLNAGESLPAPSKNLRDAVSNDLEQLLSELNFLQKCYMEELPPVEQNCNINDMIAAVTPKENQRRHSFMAIDFEDLGMDSHLDTWSFASRLEEECLMQLSALPTLHSITL